ncbi:Ras-related protein Rab-26 [Trachymyrmex zeteki]|uniref:Ras-related protein Rab-26 n=1 Tax=Mycetomoellerius zeteki TaxID=64791 RepID=A0A151XJ83_9HYME|nr:Ras-related protein Rab-26 [Trachymyrmex zeteki]
MEMSVDRRTVISAFAARQWHLRRASTELVSPVGFDNATSGTRFAESYCRNVQRYFCLDYDSQFLTTEDSMSDDVFEMDDDRSSTVTNVVSGGLTPATTERSFEKTPSPTGYRDYKPPAEVLSNNYSTTFKTTSDFDSVRSALKKDQERDDNFAHKLNFHRKHFLHGRISGRHANCTILLTDLYPLISPSIHLSDEEDFVLRSSCTVHVNFPSKIVSFTSSKTVQEGLVRRDPSNIDDRDESANPLHGTSVLRSHFYDGFVTDRVPSFTLPSRLRAVPRYTRPRAHFQYWQCISKWSLYIYSATPREFIPECNANTINNNGSLNFEHDESYKNPRESRDTTSECQVQNNTPGMPIKKVHLYFNIWHTRAFFSLFLSLIRFKQVSLNFESMRIDIGWKMDFIFVICRSTILLGDSGVGKTSLLVQFDTGRFQPGNFAATVGIGFTVSNTAIQRYLIKAFQLDETVECNGSLSVLFYEVNSTRVFYLHLISIFHFLFTFVILLMNCHFCQLIIILKLIFDIRIVYSSYNHF